jgi:hypothetical protein
MKNPFGGMTPIQKYIYGGIALIVLLVVIWLGGQLLNALGFFDSDAKQEVIELKQKEQELKGVVEGLGKAIAEERKEKEAFKAQAENHAQEALIYKSAADASNQRAADEAEKLIAEDKRYTDELEADSNTVLSKCDRWLRNCQRAIKIIKGFTGPCDCSQIKE